MSLPRERIILTAALFLLLCGELPAQIVRGLAAWHYSGQTFLSWESAGDDVRHYTIYRSRRPLRTSLALQQAEERYVVAPGQAYNTRLSRVLGVPAYYRLPGPGGALDFTDEYYVITGGSYGTWYYAVTATGGKGEERQLRTGRNTVSDGVLEYVTIPSPVHQGRFRIGGHGVDVFVHWGSNRELPGVPAMTNLPMQPFNLAVRKNGGAPRHPLLVSLHGRGGNFLYHTAGSGNPQEYILALDDALPGAARNTFWLGYDSAMVVGSPQLRPSPMTRVQPYTARRVAWTLRWALRKLPVDSARVMFIGSSMGGSGVAFALFARRFPIASALALIPRLDYTMRDLVDAPGSSGAFQHFDALWGTPQRNPKLADGSPLYEFLNFSSRLETEDLRALPHLRVISGVRDTIVGWKQVHASIAKSASTHAGITFLWDKRAHDTHGQYAWTPMEELGSLARYRSNRSWPAFSGDDQGDPQDRTVGSRNARADWFEPVVDLAESWSVGLRRHPLEMRDSLARFPERITVDVTPRRLQRFVIRGGSWYHAVLTRGGSVLYENILRAVRDGEITIPGVPLTPDPARLELRPVPGPMPNR